MDPVRNPFSPGAGTPPPELAGRQYILERVKIIFEWLVRGSLKKAFYLLVFEVWERLFCSMRSTELPVNHIAYRYWLKLMKKSL